MQGIGEKITTFTNLYFSEYSKQTLAKNITFTDENAHFIFYLFDKIIETFSSTGEMLKLSENDCTKYLKNSIYILVRSNLSDIIIIWWLLEENKQDGTTIASRVANLRTDHIKYHISYLKKMDGLGLLSKDDKEHEINVLNSIYGHLLTDQIKPDLTSAQIFKSVSISQMLNSNNKVNPALVAAYEAYFILSKVEHTGEFTRMIIERTYQDENPMDDHIKSAFFCIETTIKILMPRFFEGKEFLEKIQSFKITD